jgi:hypothetical protein
MEHEDLRAAIAESWDELVKTGSAAPGVALQENTWLTRQEVSDREKIPVATLAQWAHKGCGPKYALFGRHARYRLSDVIAWENAQFGGDAA